MDRKKIVCYTCITGNYDQLKDPVHIDNDVDYICFSDNPALKSEKWKLTSIPLDLNNLSQIKQQRTIKICPHRYLPEYDISIWVDGNIRIKGSVDMLLSEYDLESVPFYTRIHPSRNCIYDEAKIVLKLGKDRVDSVNSIIARYRDEGFPEHIGLAETNVILRRHNDTECRLFDDAWAAEVLVNSHRDQISFNYVCWKRRFNPGYMVNQFKINNNEYFEFNRHG